MVDLAEKILKAIDDQERAKPREKARSYIGASIVGGECSAFLAFCLRGFPDNEIEPRLKRIFQLGHYLEDRVVADLKAAGISVVERDPMTGRQWTYEGFEGHVIGHADGIMELENSEIAGVEIKTMGQQPFDKFKSDGVLVSHPKYFAQVQLMMGLSGIESFVVIAYCKNNSDYHAEVVRKDELYFSYLTAKIERVMRDEDVRRAAADASSFMCRFCNKSEACWSGKTPGPRCANCAHSIPGLNAGWYCRLHKRDCHDVCGDYRAWEPRSA